MHVIDNGPEPEVLDVYVDRKASAIDSDVYTTRWRGWHGDS